MPTILSNEYMSRQQEYLCHSLFSWSCIANTKDREACRQLFERQVFFVGTLTARLLPQSIYKVLAQSSCYLNSGLTFTERSRHMIYDSCVDEIGAKVQYRAFLSTLFLSRNDFHIAHWYVYNYLIRAHVT